MRSLRPDGTTKLTQLGRTFFKNRYREYVVHVLRGDTKTERTTIDLTGSQYTSWASPE